MKLLLFSAACLLVFGVAGQAGAAFSTGDLIQVMYDTQTKVEIVSDLGLANAASYSVSGQKAGSSISLSSFGTGANTWNDVQTSYFATTTGTAYVAGTKSLTSGSNPVSSFNTDAGNVEAYYASQGGTLVTNKTPSTTNSFFKIMDVGGSGTGSYGGFIASIFDSDTYTTGFGAKMILYDFTKTSQVGTSTGISIKTAVTSTNVETTTVTGTGTTGTAAPIPGAAWLFGPGLLGLIGLKRKYLG